MRAVRRTSADAVISTPQQPGAYLKGEIARWKDLAQTLKLEVAN